MRIEEEFEINAPPGDVWDFLTDPERVADALPGAEISEKVDDTTYRGSMAVKVGPVSATYKGTVSFELDESTRSAEVHAKGQGVAGMGSADMRMTSTVEEAGERLTRVQVHADLKVSGMLAQFGRGMIEQVSRNMLQQFAQNVKAELENGDG